MYLITVKEDNRIIMVGEALDYMSNGYPRLVDEDIGFPIDMVNVYEVSEMPSEVIPEKYCYTESEGFYINPDYVEPDPTNIYNIPDETYHAIINDLTTEVANSGY